MCVPNSALKGNKYLYFTVPPVHTAQSVCGVTHRHTRTPVEDFYFVVHPRVVFFFFGGWYTLNGSSVNVLQTVP